MNDSKLSRREALARLAKCSVYTAPTVVTLLSASPSYAQGSGVNDPVACPGTLTNRNPNMWPNAANVGGNQNMTTNDSAQDCGNNISMNA